MSRSVGVVIPAYRPDVDRLGAYVRALRTALDPEVIRVELDREGHGPSGSRPEADVTRRESGDGGDGVFPCREPCSMVIAAARKWTRLESEQSRTYEFDLTPSEKAQIEAIIDAVADGRADEIREADTSDGANRYRARYLRAKLFDDDGNLCGVPTDADS